MTIASGRTLVCLALVLFSSGQAQADVALSGIFGDHMVLQQDTKLPICGKGTPGENVTVTIGSATGNTTVSADGTWRVDLPPLSTTKEALTVTVSGKNTITLQDVLVGDVWLASGQSNMEFGVRNDERAADTVAGANQPMIRLFMVSKTRSLQPLTDLPSPSPGTLEGKWQVCTPETLGGHWGWNGFSAVAYYFGREIQQHTGRPVGLIGAYWGGTPAQAWTSLPAMQKEPILHHNVDAYQKILANQAQAAASYSQQQAAYSTAMNQWNQEVAPAYNQQMDEWKKASAQAMASNQPVPPQPKPTQPKPTAPPPPDGGPMTPSILFNAMINPLIPFALKGVIWYQGEANAWNGKGDYSTLFPTLIRDWRERWNEGDFPFIYVQLANFQAPQKQPSEGNWAFVREDQLQTLSLPATGMAVTIDIGDALTVHPLDKLDVGLRLALAARHVAYGEDLVYSGPIYDSMSVSGNQVSIKFKDIGSGLTLGSRPADAKGTTPPTPTKLTGFAIAGSDQKWFWADAQIEGDSVVVSSDQVPSPVAVRYGWASNPSCDLYNKEGLPASPFRTDTWPH